MNERLIRRFRKRMDQETPRRRKMAAFHAFWLIHADAISGEVDLVEICRLIGVTEAYAIELRKMRNLSKILADWGYEVRSTQ